MSSFCDLLCLTQRQNAYPGIHNWLYCDMHGSCLSAYTYSLQLQAKHSCDSQLLVIRILAGIGPSRSEVKLQAYALFI